MTRVVIAGHTSFCNRGNEALVRSTIDTLSAHLPEARFTVFSLSSELDQRRFGESNRGTRFQELNYNPAVYGKKGKAWFLLTSLLRLDVREWLRADDASYETAKACDLLVVSGGDLLSGYGLRNLKRYSYLAWIAIAFGKPVVLFAHSFNPFDTQKELQFARSFLNRVSLITVRERISKSYLHDIGVKAPVRLAGDPAFLLAPASTNRVESILAMEAIPRGNPLVGISASAGMAWYVESDFEEYTGALAATADHVIAKHEMSVVFVPHVIGPEKFGGDDRQAADAVLEKMQHKNKAYPIRGEYSCAELKGVIGHCKLFIGSRTHSTIASTSMLVPTIGLAYSVKAHGILGDLVKSRPVVADVPNLKTSDLIDIADDLIENHESIVQELAQTVPVMRERALVTPRLCAQLLTSRQTN